MARPRQDLPPKVAAVLQALIALVETDPRVVDIAAEAGVAPSYVSVTIKRLEADGYIRRLSGDRCRLKYEVLKTQ
ncbi:MAG TPA: MarR family transcriptional regulator [Herpetosiphonaceae bacterium]